MMRHRASWNRREKMNRANGMNSTHAVMSAPRATQQASDGPGKPYIHPLIYRAAEFYWHVSRFLRRIDWLIFLWIVLALAVAAYALIIFLHAIHAMNLS